MKKFIVATLLAALSTPIWATPRTVILSIPSMNCPVCPITVKKALGQVPGVIAARVNFDQRLATVTFDDATTSVDALTLATRNAGYPSTPAGPVQ